jgi:enoyl-CoA hydratase/carnithine racemase
VPGPPRISVAELAAGAADFPLLDDAGRVTGPLLAVELPAGLDAEHFRAVLRRAALRATDCPRLLVGLASGPRPDCADDLLRALDLTFIPQGTGTPEGQAATGAAGPACVAVPDPAGALEALGAAVAAKPQAALVLRQVLRATGELPVHEALDFESLAYSALLGGPEFLDWLAGRAPRQAPPEVADPVLVRRDHADDGRLLITLNRSERRNAYGRQLRDALADALRVALLDPSVTTVVIDGAGPCFSSGGDLGEFGTAPDPVTAHFVRTQAGAALLLHAVRDRAEVRVHGPCVGAGVELPAFAAIVTAAPETTFALPEAGMGLIPGAGGTVSIPRRIGRWRTLYLALSGCRLDAGTALAWGLVDRIEDAGRLDPAGPLDAGGPQPPGALTEQRQGGRDEDAADDGRVDEDRGRRADAEDLQVDQRERGEDGEHRHHDQRGAGHHSGA